jgi:hypothetical protein
MRHILRTTLLATGLLALFAVSDDATAQPSKTFHVPQSSAQQMQGAVTTSVTNISTDGLRKGGDVAANGGLDGVPVLNGFRFRFQHGDHPLRQLGLLVASPSSANVNYMDKNGDDPFNLAASWLVVRGAGQRAETIFVGNGQGVVNLVARPPNTRVVLTGFKLAFPEEHDVRLIGVWIDEATNSVRASLMDDTINVKSAYGDHLGNAANAPAKPTGEIVPDETTAWQRIAIWSSRGQHAFMARIQYAFVPNDHVAGDDYFTGTTRALASGKSFPAHTGLQGFEFYFDNSNHNLMDIGVMPPLTGGFVRNTGSLPTPADEFIEFQDKNRTDPIKWAVKVVNLK